MHHTYVPSRSTPWFAALAFFAVVCVGLHPARAQSNVLFERIPSTAAAAADAAADPAQRRQLETLRLSPTTASLELVRINVDALRAPTASMALDAAPVEAVRRNVVERSSSNFSWYGEFPGIRGQANSVVQGGEVTGSVRDGANLYSIVPIGDGTHALIKVDQYRLPPDHPPDFRQVEKRANEVTAPAAAQDAPANDTARSRIDVLVSYTGAAKAARRDIEADDLTRGRRCEHFLSKQRGQHRSSPRRHVAGQLFRSWQELGNDQQRSGDRQRPEPGAGSPTARRPGR